MRGGFYLNSLKNLNQKEKVEMEKTELFLIRRKKRITLKQIADYVGCSISLLSLYENDKAILDKNKQIKYQEFITNY